MLHMFHRLNAWDFNDQSSFGCRNVRKAGGWWLVIPKTTLCCPSNAWHCSRRPRSSWTSWLQPLVTTTMSSSSWVTPTWAVTRSTSLVWMSRRATATVTVIKLVVLLLLMFIVDILCNYSQMVIEHYFVVISTCKCIAWVICSFIFVCMLEMRMIVYAFILCKISSWLLKLFSWIASSKHCIHSKPKF